MAAGQLLDDQYEVLATISEGTHSHVYRAKERATGLPCSVKVLKTGEGRDALARFEAEAQKLRRLDHPYILRFQTFGSTSSGEPYMVMEDAGKGRSLEAILNECDHLPVDKALKLFDHICDAMGIAHHMGIYHRNLKPSKIIVTNESDDIRIKITDFGVAAILGSDYKHIANLTKPGATVSSPHYMSPEQCMARQTDGRADIYAFGCIMYRTLTGQKPFAGKNAIEVLAKHINEPAHGFKQVAPSVSVSPELEKIVLRCLEKSPEDRFASVSELRRALENFKEKGSAGSAVSHVTIPGAKPTAKEQPKETGKGKETKVKDVAPAAAPPRPQQTAPEPEPVHAGPLPEPGSGTETGRMRRPPPTNVDLNTKKSNPTPFILLALILAVSAIGILVVPKATGPEKPPSDVNTVPNDSSTLSSITPAEFFTRVNAKLPEDVKENLEKEDSFVSQSASEGGEWVTKQRVNPIIASAKTHFGAESAEMAWIDQRLGDLLLVNQYTAEAGPVYDSGLAIQKNFDFKPAWLESRTRSAIVADALASGKIGRATEAWMRLSQGKEFVAMPDDAPFKALIAELEKESSNLTLVVSSSQIPDSVMEEKLHSMLDSAESLRSRNFELKSSTLWYLLMMALNKKDNDKAVIDSLEKFDAVTRSNTQSNTAVAYLLFLASQKCRAAELANMARKIDELAVKRFSFLDEKDPLFLEYKRHYPTGLPGLKDFPASADHTDGDLEKKQNNDSQSPEEQKRLKDGADSSGIKNRTKPTDQA